MINQLKTILLLGLLTGLLLFVSDIFGGRGGLQIAFFFTFIMNVGSYWFSDKIVLAMYHAKEAKKSEYPALHKIIEDVVHKADLPKPKVYIIPTQTPNAFATGRNPNHAAIACTTGILDLLTTDELRGVIAHEISHVKNRDILITTIAATIAGVISYLARTAQYSALFGQNDNRENSSNILSMFLLAIMTPIIAALIQLAISRSREYRADETGAHTIKNSRALASALQKIDAGVRDHPLQFGNPTTSSLFILNPFNPKGFTQLFSTHPPTKERIRRLNNIKF